MTTKQKRFVEEKIKGKSGKEAAINAGYSAKTAVKIASENQTKPDIKEAIDKRMAQIEAKTDITVELIQKLHKAAMNRCQLKGDETNYKGNLDSLGKTIAAYADKSYIIPDETAKLDQSKAEEARRLASIRLLG